MNYTTTADIVYDGFEQDLEKVLIRLKSMLVNLTDELNLGSSGRDPEVISENLEFLQKRFLSYWKALDKCGYTKLIDKYADSFVSTVAKDVVDDMGLGFDFAEMDKKDLIALATYTHQALQDIGIANYNTVKSKITVGVLSGATKKDISEEIRNSIDETFKRYSLTYANTGVHLFQQKVEDITLQEFGQNPADYDWLYVGPLDNKNRPECRMAVTKGRFTYKERMEFEAEYGLRWNCRHTFHAVPKEEKPATPKGKTGKTKTDNADKQEELLNRFPSLKSSKVIDLEQLDDYHVYTKNDKEIDRLISAFNQPSPSDFTVEPPEASLLFPEQRSALHVYTEEGYKDMNRFFREPDKMADLSASYTAKIATAIQDAINGLDKLPKYEGVSMRRIGGDENKMLKLSEVYKSQYILEKAFASTTVKKQEELTRILLIIDGKSGANISSLSQYPDELEVLYPPGCEFENLGWMEFSKEYTKSFIVKKIIVFLKEL